MAASCFAELGKRPPGITRCTRSGHCAAGLIDSLRTAGVTLILDPDQRTLRCNDHIAVAMGNDR
jgi:hypothetical protein